MFNVKGRRQTVQMIKGTCFFTSIKESTCTGWLVVHESTTGTQCFTQQINGL